MLPKPGKDLYQTTSYRPISLLPVCSKILEKIIYDRLKATIEEEKLISGRQYGFRNKHSTIEQMHRLINEILLAIEKKQYCIALFMDIEKVFDKVNHKSLLQTIKLYLVQIILGRYTNNYQDENTDIHGRHGCTSQVHYSRNSSHITRRAHHKNRKMHTR